MVLSKAKIRLENGFKITALFDTGAEINIMTKKIMEDAGLAMEQGPTLELVSLTDHSWLFPGFCEDIEVVVKGLKIKHLIFVVKYRDNNLVFRQPFLNAIKFYQDYKPKNVFCTITLSQTKELAVFCTLSTKIRQIKKKITFFLGF